LRIAGVLAVVLAVVIVLVKGTIASQTRGQPYSVFIKILLNHMQMLGIIASFDMRWPADIADFLSRLAILQLVQEAVVAFDCHMDTRLPDAVTPAQRGYVPEDERNITVINRMFTSELFSSPDGEWRIIYLKLLIHAAVPVICGCCAHAGWYVVLKWQRTAPAAFPRQRYNRFISTLIILLFLVHPMISQFMVNMFRCKDYDHDVRLLKELEVICWQHMHQTLAFAIALPCGLVWGLGIPATIYSLMAKEKDDLETEAVQIRYGFLYNGYKRDNYYWEIVIMYRKICCLCVAVLLNSVGVIVQALVLVIILVVFFQLNNVLRPSCNRSLNECEDLSLLTQLLTMYCGLFFLSQSDVDPDSTAYDPSSDFILTEPTRLALLGAIVVGNVFFLASWGVRFVRTLRGAIRYSSRDLYVAVFLCCRADRLSKDDAKLAEAGKRETIIEKIEEI
jgi:hypothetical protein